MAAVTQQDWHAEAVSLREQGLSEREIAEAVGRAPSTVHDFLAKQDAPPDPIPGQQDILGGEVPRVESVYVEQIRVDGTHQIAIDFGGKQAQSCSLSISGKVDVDGFFRKGDRIRGTFEAVVTGAGAKDKLDKATGIVMEAEQTHSAKITDLIVE